jgi:hypothetical protein
MQCDRKPTRSMSTLAVGVAMSVLPLAAANAQDKRPNIATLMTDDTGWNDFGAYSGGGLVIRHRTSIRSPGKARPSPIGTGKRAARQAAPRSSPGAFRSARRCRSSSRRATRTFCARRRRQSPSSSRRTAIRPISPASGISATSPSLIRSSMASTR